jgi:threonine/homoserine/homoserine lactone efflux protein
VGLSIFVEGFAQNWWLFLISSILIELTPGPNMVYLAIVGASDGRRAGYAVTAGVALGLATVGLIAAAGLTTVINNSPALYQLLRWAGVIYLLWLAFDAWRDAAEDVDAAPVGSAFRVCFRRGLITNLLNPKAAVFYIAVLPGFTVPGGSIGGQTFVLSLTFVAAATAIHLAIVTLSSQARRLLEDPRRSLIIRRTLALALAAVAVWFAWKTRF